MEITIKTSLIDYIGELNGGVSIAIGLTIEDHFSFESIYWIHPDGNFLLEIDSDFLKLFGVSESNELPFYQELIADIDSIIETKDEIFKTFIEN
jgi:hypothetical protein